MFNGDNVVIAGGTFHVIEPRNAIHVNEPRSAIHVILKAFGENYVSSATHDNNDSLEAPKCHPGTRVSFLRRLSNWAKDSEGPASVTWLHGPAGAGKSAIARSLAQILDNDSLLAGSFFFFRTDSRRNSVNPFVATLAYQIAGFIPDTLQHIATAVEKDPAICSRSLETQFKKLIADPICASQTFVRKLLIIDGLDECINRMAILKVFFDNLPRLQGHFKFLIISRPEYDIQRFFESAATKPGQLVDTIELLGDLQAFEDVRVYLRDNFDRITRTHPLRAYFMSDWPSDDAIERLVEKSSGHFIYASTVIKYIENDRDRPQKRLDDILKLRMSSQNPYAALDALYFDILTSSGAGHGLLVNILSIVVQDDRFPEQYSYEWRVMKSTHMLEAILVLEPGKCELELLDLKSLVEVKDTVNFWHKSFSDFLLDPFRSQEFHVSSANACTLIAKYCLRLLSPNLSEQRSPSGFNSIKIMREHHHVLSFCCANAVTDVDLQIALTKYKFDLWYFTFFYEDFNVFFSCLCNYQQAHTSNKEELDVFEGILREADGYLIAELRRSVSLQSEIMKILRAVIFPDHLDQPEGALSRQWQRPCSGSTFLYYMFFEQLSAEARGCICDFFYTKSRAQEYYLGDSAPIAILHLGLPKEAIKNTVRWLGGLVRVG